jgi:hypothetical protein
MILKSAGLNKFDFLLTFYSFWSNFMEKTDDYLHIATYLLAIYVSQVTGSSPQKLAAFSETF